jgi:hypothetical protein
MFELRDDGKLFRGSLEVVPMVRDGRTVIRFVLQIADRPSWLELAMLARLEDKLRAELGAPPPPPPTPPTPPAPPPPTPPKKDEPGGEAGRRDDGPPVSPTP